MKKNVDEKKKHSDQNKKSEHEEKLTILKAL